MQCTTIGILIGRRKVNERGKEVGEIVNGKKKEKKGQ